MNFFRLTVGVSTAAPPSCRDANSQSEKIQNRVDESHNKENQTSVCDELTLSFFFTSTTFKLNFYLATRNCTHVSVYKHDVTDTGTRIMHDLGANLY